MQTKIYNTGYGSTQESLHRFLLSSYAGHSDLKSLEEVNPQTHLVVIGTLSAADLAKFHTQLEKQERQINAGTIFLADSLDHFVNPELLVKTLAKKTRRKVIYAHIGMSYEVKGQ